MTETDTTNVVSEQEFLSKLGFGEAPRGEQKPEPKKDIIDEIEAGKNNPPIEEKPIEEEKTDSEIAEQKQIDENAEALRKAEEDKKIQRFGVRDTINTLIENNEWSDIAIKYGEKQYESIEALLASEKPSRELFDSLSQIQKNLRENKIKEDYVSIKGKDETKVKLINAILSDVDYEELLNYNKNVVEPVKKLDFNTQDSRITENFIRQCLKDIDGIPDKYIEAELDELKKDFKLIEKAEEFQEKVIKKFNDEVDLRKQTQDALRAQEEETKNSNIKSFKKNLKEKDFGDSFIKQAVQLRYTKEADGKYHYEKLIEDKMKDEDFASRFIHFILDENDFLNKEKSKVKLETQQKLMEMVHIIPKENSSKASKNTSNQSLTEADENFLQEINK